MFNFISSVKCAVCLGPRQFVRQRIKLPLIKFIHDTVKLYKTRTQTGVNNVREILFRGTVVALITALLVWLAIFMYIAFYYAYVPTISHERPVYLKFRSCDKESCVASSGNKAICSFPSAHIKLTERQRLLMLGQPYKIHLDLEMPESPTNRDLGMFMVCADFVGSDGKTLINSCRSTMLHYRGFLLDTLYKIVFSPFFVFGSAEEKQNIHVELFSDFEEVESEPVTDIFIEIQTRHIEIYSARFLINAHFTGLRFLMYNWPVFSAAIGITSNLVFIAIVCMISWYQIINSEEYLQLLQSQIDQKQLKDFDSGSSSSSLDEDTSLLHENLRFRKGRSDSKDFIEDIRDMDC
ncbi:seipin [Tribolium madens]|uniref:seipin n=1 Tax=Tribolium madens TaxID=41895 RepID=UPI001CF75ECF|nr:seipin [Tribolium madens]